MPKPPKSAADLPDTLPIFPLSGALLLPQTHRPLNVFEPRYIKMIDHALATNRLIGLVQPKSDGEESPQGAVPLREIGCVGRLMHFEETADDRYLIILEGLTRFRLGAEIEADTPFRQFNINARDYAEDFVPLSGEGGVDRERFISMMRDYADYADLELDWEEIEETATVDLVNFVCMVSPYGAAEKQVLLEADTIETRAETLMAMAELEMARARSGTTLQ